MKKIIYTIAFALMATSAIQLASCDKIKDAAKVNINLDNGDGTFTIPELITTGEVALGTDDIYINLDSMIKAQNDKLGAKNIREVKVKSCELSLLDGDKDNNFSVLEACKLEIKSNTKTEFITLGSVTNNPDVAAQTLNLPVNESLDLKDYFTSATQFSYRLSGKTRKTTNKELNCKVMVKYTIVAGL